MEPSTTAGPSAAASASNAAAAGASAMASMAVTTTETAPVRATAAVPSASTATSPAASGTAASAGDEGQEVAGGLPKGSFLPSIVTEADLKILEKEGLIPPKKVCPWRAATGDDTPAPSPEERVMLTSHIYRGLSLPPSDFFTEVLDYYGLQPHNLGPNSILAVSCFKALFEGYLGIQADLEFFKYCFLVKRQTTDSGRLAICGSVSFNIRRHREWYPKVPNVDSIKEWTSTFFYCKDMPAEGRPIGLPAFRNSAPEERACWDEDPEEPLPGHLLLMKRRIEYLTRHAPAKNLTGLDTFICWFRRRVQPLRDSGGRLLCTYTDKKDSLRICEKDLNPEAFFARLKKLIRFRDPTGRYAESCPMHTANNPPEKVMSSAFRISYNLKFFRLSLISYQNLSAC